MKYLASFGNVPSATLRLVAALPIVAAVVWVVIELASVLPQ